MEGRINGIHANNMLEPTLFQKQSSKVGTAS